MSQVLSQSLQAFGHSVGSDSFAPGGGAVSALSGSLSAALAKMVFSLTVGKKKYAEFDAENRKLLEAVGTRLELLLACVEKDISGCDAILAALALPKDTEPEKARRRAAISEASKKANEAPIEVCGHSIELLRLFKSSLPKVNKNTITDWGVGAMQAYAALEGASMNAKINCGSVDDPKYKAELAEKFRAMLGEGRGIIDEIRHLVHSHLDSTC